MAVIMTRPSLDPSRSRSPLHAKSNALMAPTTIRGTHPDIMISKSCEMPPIGTTSPIQNRRGSFEYEGVDLDQMAQMNMRSSHHNIGLPAAMTDVPRGHICLCQPDPKIPRPRNAFILYRQHYQTQVIAQNPGLSNPEISKIIGEQWRDQPNQVKNEWKKLAEEEKQRHQRQYPDYRYQPRRAGRSNIPKPLATGTDSNHCPKCKGQYIVAAGAPLTPLSSNTGRSSQEGSSLSSEYHRPQNIDGTMLSRSRSRSRSTVDEENMPDTGGSRRYSSSSSRPGSGRSNELSQRQSPTSPTSKRRRIHDDLRSTSQQSHNRGPSRSDHSPWPGTPYARDVRGTPSFPPRLGPQHLQETRMMEPPPRPSPIIVQRPARTGQFDETLRLPPLKTPLSTPRLDAETAIQIPPIANYGMESQARSVEAMVMSIPYLNKLKVLSKIAPPIAPTSPTSPAFECRGAIIAVEGAHQAIISKVGRFLEAHLLREPECVVRTWTSEPSSIDNISEKSPVKTATPLNSSGSLSPASSSSQRESLNPDPFLPYLQEIQGWHRKSEEMINFITTTPPNAESRGRIPVALCPAGFSLSLSDKFASRTPINDSYAPVDHWQWMATLWRGIAGPDLTIYVKAVPSPSLSAMGSVVEPKSVSLQDEMARFGAVEICHDCAAIIVRIPLPPNVDEANTFTGVGADISNVPIEDRTFRRLGFEVLEFIRNLSSEGLRLTTPGGSGRV